MSKKSLTIFAHPGDDGGCGNYRIIQPIKALTRRGHTISIPGKGLGSDKLLQESQRADVVVLQRPTSKGAVNYYQANRLAGKQLSVFEHDDNPWDLHPMNDSYRSHGTQEIYLDEKQLKAGGYYDEFLRQGKIGRDGKFWIWKDGVAGFDVARNIETTKFFNSAIVAADLVTTTTEILADDFRKHLKVLGNPDPQVEALPNCLNLSHWFPTEIVKPKDEVRIVWQGGASHFDDWMTIAKPMEEVLKRHQNVKLYIIGSYFPGATKNMDPKQVVVNEEWSTFDAHPYRLKLTGADIGIIPLQDTHFNACKSDIKFTEYSALGIPTVAQNLSPYKESIEDGKTGFLVNTPKEWVSRLSALIKSAELRKKTAANARKWVEKERDADKTAILWEKVYLKHLRKKKEKS